MVRSSNFVLCIEKEKLIANDDFKIIYHYLHYTTLQGIVFGIKFHFKAFVDISIFHNFLDLNMFLLLDIWYNTDYCNCYTVYISSI